MSDDSGLEINLLKGQPGVYSSRWGGKENNFNLAIKKIFTKINKVKKKDIKKIKAKFICSMTLFWPNKKSFTVIGKINGNHFIYYNGNYINLNKPIKRISLIESIKY